VDRISIDLAAAVVAVEKVADLVWAEMVALVAGALLRSFVWEASFV
jgi:DNA-binding SARP family transcriptional activator